MCLIIDANVVSLVFPAPSEDFRPVHEALISGKARFVYGGKLTQEYAAITSFRRLLLLLDQRGSARQVADATVNAEAERLRAQNLCRSDDQHIVGPRSGQRSQAVVFERSGPLNRLQGRDSPLPPSR